MTNRAWAVFTIDANGKAEMLEVFESAAGFSLADAKAEADEIREEEKEYYNNDVEVRSGTMVETSQGPWFQENVRTPRGVNL